jgi:4-hydroxyacetophenone monooxygenase
MQRYGIRAVVCRERSAGAREDAGMAAPQDLAPLTADDATLARHITDAAVPAILPAVAHLTGDLDVLRDDLRPDPLRMLEPDAGYDAERLADARALALEALKRYRDGGGVPAPPPGPEGLARLLTWLAGTDDVEAQLPLFEEELGLTGDRRTPDWTVDDVSPDTDFRVAVVGAGMSGLAAAHRLRQAGVDVVVLEKNSDVGGTWFDNTYPGCRVDVPNHLYSYSFAQKSDWPEHFSTQEVLLDYFRQCADELELRPLIRFETEVTEMAWSEDAAAWHLCLRTPGGEQELEAQVVVSAVGQLNRPRFPDIDGRDDFAGPSFHSARWEHDIDLKGKRIGVIGTGASGAQFIPEVAAEAAEVFVFQRTPPWFIPTPDNREQLPEGLTWLFDHLPGYAQWYRFWLFWRYSEGMLPATEVDPDWDDGGRSVSALNEMVRILLAEYIETEFADAPELLPSVVPDYPPAAKRLIRDDGTWADTLTADHVDLVTDRIERITPSGVVTEAGVEREVDVIVYGTGFQASRFLTPMRVTGRAGADLHEHWDGDARAYLGMTVPQFPNLFCLYGPNTNIVINGSIIYFSECEVQYLLDAVRLLLGGGHGSMAVRPEVYDAHNERVDEANRARAWGASEVSSWYKNETGRVTQNWPFSLFEFWERTREVEPDDYVLD